MPTRTQYFKLSYYREREKTTSREELQRFETLDAQLQALFKILGNGVIKGMNILPLGGLGVVIGTGTAHVNFVAVENTSLTVVSGLTPLSRNYIYATLTTSSYWDKSVAFVATTAEKTQIEGEEEETYLYLGYVDTNELTVTGLNEEGRASLGFSELITQLISEHRHIGGTGNPQPVDLSSEVQGIIKQRNLPEMDASLIQSGTIDPDHLPEIDHITKLVNQGTLTHAQLDSFVTSLDLGGVKMGEASTVNLLQLILSLKHVYPEIDEFLVNEIAYIPGISPDSYVDWDNTTAIVDTNTWKDGGTHTITGLSSDAQKTYTKTWETTADFESGTEDQVLIYDNVVSLDVEENTQIVDVFDSINDWTVVTDDLSAISSTLSLDGVNYVTPPTSGQIIIGNKEVEIALVFRKDFDASDWSKYKSLTFFIRTENVEHGDLFFFIVDDNAGTQNSFTKVLDRKAPTVNEDTLQNGWQQIRLDISDYTRSAINSFGFYFSTQEGWDTSTGFDLNIDRMALTSTNSYKENGYVRLTFGSEFLRNFYRLRWDSFIPTDSQALGADLRGRVRVANTEAALAQATWSDYITDSGTLLSFPQDLYKYIEVEMYLEASTNLNRSPILETVYVDYYSSDSENSINYDSQDDWENGKAYNVDTTSSPGDLLISKVDEIGHYYYATDDNKVIQADSDFDIKYEVTGTKLPRSVFQAYHGLPPGFGHISGLSRGDDGTYWVSDLGGNRVVEVDKAGNLIRGFAGAYLENLDLEILFPSEITDPLIVLQTLYNPNNDTIYMIFNQSLVGKQFDKNRMVLKIGAQVFFLNDIEVEVGEADGLNVATNILRIKLLGGTKDLLNSLIDTGQPTVSILDPKPMGSSSSRFTAKLIISNFEFNDGKGAKVTIDGQSFNVFTNEFEVTGVANGLKRMVVQLFDENETLYTNIEAKAYVDIHIVSSSISEPYIYINSPIANQVYSSGSAYIEFKVSNFSIVPNGPHISYSIDGGEEQDHYSEDPILLTSLSNGEHVLTVKMVDEDGTDLGYTYGTAVVKFIVGLNSNLELRVAVQPGAFVDASGANLIATTNQLVEVGNLKFYDIYSPMSVQYVLAPNKSGEPTVLISKLDATGLVDIEEVTSAITDSNAASTVTL